MDGIRAAMDALEAAFGQWVVDPLAAVIFFDLWFWDDATTGVALPIVVVWLILGASFFTLRFRFVCIWGFRHAVDLVLGRTTAGDASPGEVSHFQALATAISGTVGIGNIGGNAAGAIARQPEAADDIKGYGLLMAALVEGVALFAAVIGLLMSF